VNSWCCGAFVAVSVPQADFRARQCRALAFRAVQRCTARGEYPATRTRAGGGARTPRRQTLYMGRGGSTYPRGGGRKRPHPDGREEADALMPVRDRQQMLPSDRARGTRGRLCLAPAGLHSSLASTPCQRPPFRESTARTAGSSAREPRPAEEHGPRHARERTQHGRRRSAPPSVPCGRLSDRAHVLQALPRFGAHLETRQNATFCRQRTTQGKCPTRNPFITKPVRVTEKK
jgi:hypothetical protein